MLEARCDFFFVLCPLIESPDQTKASVLQLAGVEGSGGLGLRS